jgi:hypothetical protein
MGFFGLRPPHLKIQWGDRTIIDEEFPIGVEGMELYRRSFDQRFETGFDARLQAENRNGLVSIRTHDQPAVVIDVVADIYAASNEEANAELERIRRGISIEGNRVLILTPELQRPEWFFFGRGSKVDYEIRVPAQTEVVASSRNGAVRLAGTGREAKLESRNGRVTAEDVGANVVAGTRNGRMDLTRIGGSVTASGTNGHITVEKAQGDVTVETRNGAVEITDAGGRVTAGTTNGPIRYTGAVRGDFDLHASNGSIRMAVPGDSRFEIDAESRHGSVRSDLRVREERPSENQGPAPKVRLRTTNGSIRLTEA